MAKAVQPVMPSENKRIIGSGFFIGIDVTEIEFIDVTAEIRDQIARRGGHSAVCQVDEPERIDVTTAGESILATKTFKNIHAVATNEHIGAR